MVNAIIGTFVLGLAALASAAPNKPVPTPGVPNNGAVGVQGSSSGAPSKSNPPAPNTSGAPVPSALGSRASGGAGDWSFDFNYLGCVTGDARCSRPVWDRYSPEASPKYVTGNGGNIEVRLWSEMKNCDFDLYVEEYTANGWQVVHSSAQNGWQDKVVFRSRSGAAYRFRAYRYTGAGYYVLSWKFA